MSRSTATASPLRHAFSADDALFVLSKGTRRIEPLSLVRALHANEVEVEVEEQAPRSQEMTLLVHPEENLRLLASAFTNPDDQITLAAPAPVVPSYVPSPLGAPPTFGVRKSISPHVAQAAREAREATRTARAAKARTRLVVLGIWGTAVMLLALLAFFATSS